MSDSKAVKDFWNNRAGTGGIQDSELTHRDVWQRWLEIDLIKRYLKGSDRVIDIGCGNGYTTRRIAPLVGEVLGVDYSEEMINRANTYSDPSLGATPPNMKFAPCDVTKLNPSMFGLFDLAISERCLINLASWEAQQGAITNIASVLKPGGRFLFIEGSKEGRDRLNAMRVAVGLEPMPPVWHNIDFAEKDLLQHLSHSFEVIDRLHFGVYDFIARIVHPLAVAPEAPQYDARINQVAAELSSKVQELGDLSRVAFLVLRKK